MKTLSELWTELREIDLAVTAAESNLQALKKRQTQLNASIKQKKLHVFYSIDEVASKILDIEGDWAKYLSSYEEARKAIKDAIADILIGGKTLLTHTIGCKSYDRWACQRCDCSYSMGPRHGCIIISIGFTTAFKEKLKKGHVLTDDEKQACITYLTAMLKGADNA